MTRAEELAKLIREAGLKIQGEGAQGMEIQQDPVEAGEFLAWCEGRGVITVLELGTGKVGGFARFMMEKMGWGVVSVDIRDVPDHPADEFIHASTVDAYPQLYGREFDLVFVDAAHTYEAAIRDFRLYQHHAPIVAVHDIAKRLKNPDAKWALGVGVAWDEIAAEYPDTARTFINEKNPLGIGVIEREVRPRVNLSIVTGTHNRFAMLKKMIASARANIPVGITYEFVIVAQGCTDGSLEWLREQADVHLLEYPDLIGGIRAFNIGCYAARGAFVIVANDDIKFHNGSILRALSHLAETPTCGQVAFAPYPPGRVKVMPAHLGEQPKRVYYGETCLVPKWLGDWCDWWGAYSGMSPRAEGLYGGDNYLSSSIWEAGYKVDSVEGVSIDDFKPFDAIKQKHAGESIKADNLRYNTVFPKGAALGNAPRFGPRPRTLRILNMPIIANERSRASKHAEREALQEFALVVELDFMHDGTDPARLVKVWQPDLIFTQFHSPNKISPQTLVRMRAAKPDTVIVNRNFDAQDIKHFSEEMHAILQHVDLQLHKEMDKQERFDREGTRARYWIEGYETPVGELPEVESFDVICQMNIFSGGHRDLLKRALEDLNGVSVGLFGYGWTNPTGNTHYDFTTGEALYKAAKIAVSDTFPNTSSYMSRRVAQIMAAGGAICLLQHSPGLDEAIGFEAGVHYDEWRDYDELREKIAYWLDGRRESKRRKMAEAAQEFAREHLSCPATMRALWYEILPEAFGVQV